MAKWIQGHVDQASWKSLTLKSSKFQWKKSVTNGGGYCLDGPTILKLIFDTINPSAEIGTDVYFKMIQNCCLAKLKYNVNKALDEIEWTYKQITLHGETYDSLYLHVYDLLLSTKNDKFVGWTKHVNQDINTGTGEYKGYDAIKLIHAAQKNYINLKKSGSWPQDAKFVVLATQFADLIKSAHVTNGGNNRKQTESIKKPGGERLYKEWQLKKISDTMTHNGKTWWWC